MDSFQRDGLTFDVVDEGPADGPVVVLLHGFPQRNECWSQVIELLTAQGYRCLAPNQRGYSAGARPRGRHSYRVSELVGDLTALIDAVGAEKIHLVGHDWGAIVAWAFAAKYPERLSSLAALSVPHPAGFARAAMTSRQGLSSWYMLFFQLPVLPEQLLKKAMAKQLPGVGLPPAAAARVASAMTEPGALSAALNWYRAIPFGDRHEVFIKVSVPTLFVWSDGDVAIRRNSAESCRDWVTGPFRFEVLEGVSHWIPDEAPEETAAMLREHFAAHS